jgi:hypothetical protein
VPYALVARADNRELGLTSISTIEHTKCMNRPSIREKLVNAGHICL